VSPERGRRLLAGLRPRLLLAFVATSAVTLGAAALVLLSPLQERLRQQSQQNLQASVLTARPGFERELRRTRGRSSLGLGDLANDLQRQTNSRVVVTDDLPSEPRIFDTGNPDRDLQLLSTIIRTTIDRQVTVRTNAGVTRIAVPLQARGEWYVLAVRRTTDDVAVVVSQVREAFLTAALIGLAVALVLGLALTGTLTRRLERLREVALRIAEGGPSAPAPVDDSNDEVGDLARTLATMQEALRRQEAARRAFVATASHELRTPLTSLGGMLELLAEDLSDDHVERADAQRQLGLAQTEVARLAGLASDLLDLSRLDTETPLRSEPVELTEVCRAVSAEFDTRARAVGVELDVITPPGPCWARGDPGAVARIVRILLDNALRHAPPRSTVWLSPAYHGTGATLEVEDAGGGVAHDDRDRIFERFERGTDRGAGFGLGLAIGRELAQRQLGRLELQGGPRGARFRLTLPIALLADGAATPSERQAARPLRAPSAKQV